MRFILLLFTLFVFAFPASSTTTSYHQLNTTYAALAKDSVYVCNSQTAYAYHSTINAKGLNRCTHQIIKVSKDDADKVYGRVPCKICE